MIKVLLLEDCEEDASLVLRELARSGFCPQSRRVSTEADFVAALEPSLDVILADFGIPGWDTLKALAVLQGRGWDIPFIIVSGTIGEERGVAAMRQGAADYVLKDRLARLGPAVEHALKQKRLRSERRELDAAHAAERQQAEDALRRSEARLAGILNASMDAVITVDAALRVVMFNPSSERLFGHRAAEVMGRPLTLFIRSHVPTGTGDRVALAELLADGHRHASAPGRIAGLRSDGEEFPVEFSISKSEVGSQALTTLFVRDISARLRAQEALALSEKRYRALFNENPLPMWVYEIETLAFLAVNQAAIEHYGYTRAQFLEMTIEDIRPAEDLPQLAESLSRDTRGIDYSGVWRHLTHDGRVIHAEITSHPVDFAGHRARLVLANDVSERIEQQNRIARLSRIRAVIGGITSAIVRSSERDQLLQEACQVACTEGVFPMAWAGLIDPQTREGRMVASCGIPPDYRDSFRFSADPGSPIAERPLSRCAREGTAFVCNDVANDPEVLPVREQMLARGHRSGAVFPLRTDQGVIGIFALSATEIGFFDHEEVVLLEWLAADLSFALDRMAKAEQLDYLAYYDALTGLPNGALFRDRLRQLIRSALRDRRQVALILLDLVQFKRVNDVLGRQSGDEALRRVGQRLRTVLDDSHSLGRLGPNVFGVARVCDGQAEPSELKDQLIAAFAQPFDLDGREIRIGVRAGIALCPSDTDEVESLIASAETALTQAKAADADSAYYSHEQSVRVSERLLLEEQLRRAIAERQFVLHYQPRADLVSGELVGSEALIRWQHPEQGLIGPNAFIELAEDTGLIVPIGAWALESACAQQAAWVAADLDVVPVAVNVSSVQFARADLLDTVRAQLAAHRLEPRYLELELTETAVMRDAEDAVHILQSLRALGVGLALDDFGTGYSSLAHLKRFPFGAVKIDRAFVTDITHNADDATIATAIIAMAHRLGLKVVAEGVETAGQLTYLRGRGCDEVQGHYFSPPVPAHEFEAMLRTRRRVDLPPKASADQQTLLVVDDEPGIRSALNRVLRRDGYRILSASSGREALDVLAVNPVQVIISDQRMPEMSGTAFLSEVKQLYPDTVRIVLSGYTDLQAVTEAVNRGAVFKFLTKPWDDELLRDQVRDAFRRYRPQSD